MFAGFCSVAGPKANGERAVSVNVNRATGRRCDGLFPIVLGHDPEKACPGLDPGWVPVSRLREALA